MQNRTRLSSWKRASQPLLCLVALAAAGCSDLDPDDDTWETVNKSGDVDGPVVADWSCLGQPEPQPPATFPETVTYTFPIVEWVSNMPPAGRTIRVCNRLDPLCMSPLDAVVNIVEGQRDVSVQIPAGQNVYLEIDTMPRIALPYVLYFDGPLYSDQRGGRIQMLTPATAIGMATQLQAPLDIMLGVLAMRPHDCLGQIVPGALYSIDETAGTSIPYTVVNGQPVSASPAMPAVTTLLPSDQSPWAGFVNVPTGRLSVFGVLDEGKREIGTATIFARPSTVNVVEIRPLNELP